MRNTAVCTNDIYSDADDDRRRKDDAGAVIGRGRTVASTVAAQIMA